MIEKLTGFVIEITRHNDRHNIVTLFTRSRGRIPFLSAAGGGRSGRLRNSRLQPLAVVEADVNMKQTAELQKLGNFSLAHVWSGIYFHPVKGMIVLFLTEFLNRLLRATMADESLFDFIVDSLRLFDSMEEGIADFHIGFMASLLPFFGIQPESRTYTPGCCFDLRSGVFTTGRPMHSDYLQPEDAALMARLGEMDFSNIGSYGLGNEVRQRMLWILLRYYGYHYPGSDSLTSLGVLQELR